MFIINKHRWTLGIIEYLSEWGQVLTIFAGIPQCLVFRKFAIRDYFADTKFSLE